MHLSTFWSIWALVQDSLLMGDRKHVNLEKASPNWAKTSTVNCVLVGDT